MRIAKIILHRSNVTEIQDEGLVTTFSRYEHPTFVVCVYRISLDLHSALDINRL